MSKLLLFIISPFFWLVVFVIYTGFGKRTKWMNRSKWGAIIIFIFFSNTYIFSEFCRLWEVHGVKINTVKRHDVAIVLGGMFEFDSELNRISIRRQGDRLFQAISLYKSGKVDKILISGDSGFISDYGLHEAKQVKELLVIWGIPNKDILTEEISKNTHENAVETKKILDKSYPHYERFILVTSGIHMKRALACFNNEGLQCTPFSTDLYTSINNSYYWDQFLIPNFDNFNLWNKLLKETFRFEAYKIAGYL
ncbi:MAG: YdcF family protein [Crocinitomicaceae bacterium]